MNVVIEKEKGFAALSRFNSRHRTVGQFHPPHGLLTQIEKEGKSGADGTFSIANVAAGEFNAYIQDDTHVLVGSPPTLRVEQGRDTPGIRLPVAVGGAVTGRAYDVDTGEPLENVVIRSRHGGGASRP